MAKRYDETRGSVGIRRWHAESVEVRRNVTISVRFSDEEIALLRERAEGAGTEVAACIRAAALQQAAPVDRMQVIGPSRGSIG